MFSLCLSVFYTAYFVFYSIDLFLSFLSICNPFCLPFSYVIVDCHYSFYSVFAFHVLKVFIVFCCFFFLITGKQLSERNRYSVFVRAWYSANEFAVFKSPGVMIYSTPPKSTKLLGRQVSEPFYLPACCPAVTFCRSVTYIGNFLFISCSSLSVHAF